MVEFDMTVFWHWFAENVHCFFGKRKISISGTCRLEASKLDKLMNTHCKPCDYKCFGNGLVRGNLYEYQAIDRVSMKN